MVLLAQEFFLVHVLVLFVYIFHISNRRIKARLDSKINTYTIAVRSDNVYIERTRHTKENNRGTKDLYPDAGYDKGRAAHRA